MGNTEIKVVRVLTAGLKPNPDNPRIVNQKSPKFLELIESIKRQGVLIPLHVWKRGDELMILAGERRWRAATSAELFEVPAIVREDLTEEEAFEITFTENFAREDLTPLEEGKGVKTLLDKYKGDVNAVAGKLGKSRSWIHSAVKVFDGLIDDWKKKLSGDLAPWTMSHWVLIARLSQEVQQDLAKARWWNAETWSVKQLEKKIQEHERTLAGASWPLDEPIEIQGKKLIACLDCPNRMGHQPQLFSDDPEPAIPPAKDRCLKADCWELKQVYGIQLKAAAMREKGEEVVFISRNYLCYSDRIQRLFGQVIGERDYRLCKKKTPGAVRGLVVETGGKDLGTTAYVELAVTARQKGKTITAEGKAVTPLKERRRQLESKRSNWVIEKVKKTLMETGLEWIAEPLDTLSPYATLMRLAVTFGVDNLQTDYNGGWKGFSNDGPPEYALNGFWKMVRMRLKKRLDFNGGVTQVPDWAVEECRQICGLIQLDYEDLRSQAERALPEPKSWKKLNADGTPKTAGVSGMASKKKTRQPAAKKKVPRKGRKAEKK